MANKTQNNGKAAAAVLSPETELRLVYLLLMHQNITVNYDGFDPGTGHSTSAIQGLMDRLKEQYITDTKPDDGSASVAASATPAIKAAPKKKRGRPKKADATATDADTEMAQPSAKKRRKTTITEEPKDEDTAKKGVSPRKTRATSKAKTQGHVRE